MVKIGASKNRTGVFEIFNLILMGIIIIITLYPFWYAIVVSFSGIIKGGGIQLWPNQFSFEAYELLFDYKPLWVGYRNTILRCVVGTTLSVLFTALTAYPLSKKDLPFQNFFTNFILFTMLFSGGLVPSYLLMKDLNLLNSLWVLILPSLIGAYNVFIMRNFFRSIPSSLEEAALIDGANWFYIWWKIIIPLAKPVVATVALWILVGHWNSWFDASIYITDPNKTVVQVVLRRISIENNSQDINAIMAQLQSGHEVVGKSLEMAMVVATMIPMLIVYPFLQRYFVKGIMVGSIKG